MTDIFEDVERFEHDAKTPGTPAFMAVSRTKAPTAEAASAPTSRARPLWWNFFLSEADPLFHSDALEKLDPPWYGDRARTWVQYGGAAVAGLAGLIYADLAGLALRHSAVVWAFLIGLVIIFGAVLPSSLVEVIRHNQRCRRRVRLLAEFKGASGR